MAANYAVAEVLMDQDWIRESIAEQVEDRTGMTWPDVFIISSLDFTGDGYFEAEISLAKNPKEILYIATGSVAINDDGVASVSRISLE